MTANSMVCIQNCLSLNCPMLLIKTLSQFVKDSFVVPSTSIRKNSNIFQKNSVYPQTFYLHSFLLLTSTSTSTSTLTFTKSITSCNKKSLLKSLYTQQKKLSSLTKDCNLPIFTPNESITNLMQYELSQKESNLLTAGLYFSIQTDNI